MRLLVAGLQDRQRHPPGKDFRQVAAALVRQVQHHNDRQPKALAQRAKDIQQRLHPAGRRADHDGFYGRQARGVVHDLR